jgi:hypothetical protein
VTDQLPFTPPNHGKSIAEKVWDLLDETVAKIHQAKADNTSYVLPTMRANTLAECIVLMCQPYYADVRAVSMEAGRRHKMAEGSLGWEPTPGYRYNPAPGGAAYPVTSRSEATSATSRGARPTPKPELPADKRAAIASALAMGMPPEALAQAYSVTIDQVNSCKPPA